MVESLDATGSVADEETQWFEFLSAIRPGRPAGPCVC